MLKIRLHMKTVAKRSLSIILINNVQEYLEEYVGSTTRRAILYQVRTNFLYWILQNLAIDKLKQINPVFHLIIWNKMP